MDVRYILKNMCFPEARPLALQAYKNKQDFGDLDILVDSEALPSNWVDIIQQVFKPREMVKNSNVLSFEYRQLQVDLIVTDPSEMMTSYCYFAFNDLGNLLGRVAHSLGLKLGHDGLSYNWRVDTYQFRNVILLTDWKDILPVLGYSYERYAEGFDTIEDIFKFVVSSPFFHKDIYLLNNRNHTSRVRDAKRKTYMDFLKWIEDDMNVPSPWNCCRFEDKKDWLPYLFAEIQGFRDTYNKVQAEWNFEVEYKKRFNGGLVKQWTGLEGKELGKFMQMMQSQGGSRFKTDIVNMNSTLIERYVSYFYDKYCGNLTVINFTAEDLKPHRTKGVK